MFQEVLRLYPPVPALSKLAHKGMDLSGYSIPERTVIMVLLTCAHIIIKNYRLRNTVVWAWLMLRVFKL